MPSARVCAALFAALSLLIIGFQIALALGAPWGAYAMGGAAPGVLPPALRVVAIAQAGLNAVMAAVVLMRAGLFLRQRPIARVLVWIVVALGAVALALNLITPSAGERLLWAPVAAGLLACSLRVALSPRA